MNGMQHVGSKNNKYQFKQHFNASDLALNKPKKDVEAYKGTRRKHNMKFKQIGHTTSQYGQSFFSQNISAWNGLAFAEAPSLTVFR